MDLIPYLLGVVFTTVGFYMLYDAYYFRKHARAYMGKIIAYKKRIDEQYAFGDARYTYYPVVEYCDENRERHEFISDTNMEKSYGDVGDSVDILVLDDNHSTARIKLQSRLVLAYAFAIVGPIVLLVGLIVSNRGFMTSFLFAIILIAILFYLTQVIVASSRKKKLNPTFPLFEDDEESIEKSETPPSSSKNYEHNNATGQPTSPQNISSVRIIFSSVFFILAISVFWFGLSQANDVSENMKTGVKVQGTVVEDEVHREGGADVHTQVIAYKPIDADSVRITLKTAAPEPEYKVGDTVDLVYQPGDYGSAKEYAGDVMINSYKTFIYIIGSIFLLIGFFLMPKRASK